MNLPELYKNYEFCCEQWKKVLDDKAIRSVFILSDVLSKVSIKSYDKPQKTMELAYNPRHKPIMFMYDSNPVIFEVIREHFGNIDIVFKANSSIVDPQPKEEDERIQRSIFHNDY